MVKNIYSILEYHKLDYLFSIYKLCLITCIHGLNTIRITQPHCIRFHLEQFLQNAASRRIFSLNSLLPATVSN